jgi:acetate kinase
MQADRVLVVNAGSSSLKLRLLEGVEVVRSTDLPADGDAGAALRDWPTPDVVGHRVVHGGTEFTGPVRVDAGVRRALGELTDLAPLHQPTSLAALDAVSALLPGVPAVACFDTAFHADLPDAAATCAVPLEWRRRWGIRRYGFHGLSHAWAARRAAELVGRPVEQLRVVSCHLGAGASVTAVLGGRSVDTTMGFTPLDGLVMATRSGSVDPGLVLWLLEHEHLAAHEVAAALEQRSGLLALAGTADLEEVVRRSRARDPRAVLALEVYLHALVAGVAAMTAATGGLDVLVLTGGVGEHSAVVRARAAEALAFLGVVLDGPANDRADADADVSATGSSVRTLVVTAREDLQIAHEVRTLTG